MMSQMQAPLAYFLTWTTYGTWLPGDERGWVETGKGIQPPDAERRTAALALMTATSCSFDTMQRETIEQTITDHCKIRSWELHAVNCRSNHVHVVVTANATPRLVLEQVKAYCTRRLKEQQRTLGMPLREKWWTEGGSKRFLNSEASLEAAIHYVLFGQ